MLYLIQRNRLGRNIINKSEEVVNWREAFKVSEDSLTSSVFSLLFYLPTEILWSIILQACNCSQLPSSCGKLIEYDFWPHWDCSNTENTNYIEPDLFIDFENFHLVVEAKRYDFVPQQNRSQWKAEITAYHNQYPIPERKPLFFIALGGLAYGDETHDSIESIPIISCRWKNIFSAIKKQLVELTYDQSNHSGVINILRDLTLVFSLHGFRTGVLFETMPLSFFISSIEDIRIQQSSTRPKLAFFEFFPTSLLDIKFTKI